MLNLLRAAGVSALFKGIQTPLASAALLNAITFGAYEQCRRVSELFTRVRTGRGMRFARVVSSFCPMEFDREIRTSR